MVLSIDSNILLAATAQESVFHPSASEFVRQIQGRDDVMLSEFMLAELYVLLRNPAILAVPHSEARAAAACQQFRNHPRWRVVALPPDSRSLHDELWQRVAEPGFPRRRIYDLRMALSLIHHGVDEFATANIRDFQDAGFRRVWNPLAA